MRVETEIFRTIKKELKHYCFTELAAVAGVAPSTLSMWNTGQITRPRIDTLLRVAEAMGFTIEVRTIRK